MVKENKKKRPSLINLDVDSNLKNLDNWENGGADIPNNDIKRRRKNDKTLSEKPKVPEHFKKCTVDMNKKDKYLEIKSIASKEEVNLWEIYDYLNDYFLVNKKEILKETKLRRK